MKQEITTKAIEDSSMQLVRAACSTDQQERREKIAYIEAAMLEKEQIEIPVKHCFHGDMYSREIIIPGGTLLTGRIHKFDHFDVMLSGDCTVSTDNGEVKRLTGLNIMKGLAGKKRIGYVHKDTHWITFHSAEEQDPENMYEFLTCGSFEELENFNIAYENAMKNIEESEKLLTEHAQSVVSKEKE